MKIIIVEVLKTSALAMMYFRNKKG